MSKTALIVVDFQKDFRKGGTLEAARSEEALEPLLRLAAEVDFVVASRDWHPKDHCSFSKEPNFEDTWPVHCAQDTEGAEIAPEITAVADAIVTKGDQKDADAFSAFDGHTGSNHSETLTDWLNEHDVETVIIGGLVTEVCVKATALDAKKEGFRTIVNIYASAALGEAKDALNEMKQRGVYISYRNPVEEDKWVKRDRVMAKAVETIKIEAEEADRQGNRQLSDWFGTLLNWLDSMEDEPDAFMIAFPNFTYEEVQVLAIPEARSVSGTK